MATIIVRVPVGLLLLFASTAYFFDLAPQPELEGDLLRFNEGMAASTYLMPLVKTLELICGLALLTGLFVPLAAVVLFPLSVNILMVHSFLDPAGLPVAIFLLTGNLFLVYACRRHYRQLFSTKIQQS